MNNEQFRFSIKGLTLKRSVLIYSFLGGLILSIFIYLRVSADAAPPQPPPGGSIDPGGSTQVRMMSEKVVITVSSVYPKESEGQANVHAIFHMENLGEVTESLNVRFPLTDISGYGDGFDHNPEIKDLRVKVNGTSTVTTRLVTENERKFSGFPIVWSSFPVVFHPGEAVDIEVVYTLEGAAWDTDYYPFVQFNYILETGAGWKDSIGEGDIIFRLPYEASPENVSNDSGLSYSLGEESLPTFSGRDVIWHFVDFEPGEDQNIEIWTVKPRIWLSIQNELANVKKHPNDGEAWGRLGKLYKRIMSSPKPFISDDLDIASLYPKAVDAYEKAISLKPEDALWHLGYAELLFNYHNSFYDPNAFRKSLEELALSLDLLPGNEQALDLVEAIEIFDPGWITQDGTRVVFTGLTQTSTEWIESTQTPKKTSTIPSSTTILTQTVLVTKNPPEKLSSTPEISSSIKTSFDYRIIFVIISLILVILFFLWLVLRKRFLSK